LVSPLLRCIATFPVGVVGFLKRYNLPSIALFEQKIFTQIESP
jgi:hypothetical protein